MSQMQKEIKNKDTLFVILCGNSLGLENDSLVLKAALQKASSTIQSNLILGRKNLLSKVWSIAQILKNKVSGKTLIFIHMEEVQSKLTWMATRNYLIPNQDWFRSQTEKVTLANENIVLLCKTRDALRAFSDIKDRSHYLGFTSLDRYQNRVKKDYRKCLHLAGKSEKKGTLSVIDAWKKHPDWPTLTLQTTVESHINLARNVPNIHLITSNQSGENLLNLMNSHGVHICISEMEGFGHYIVEALSTGAIVVTTDGAPMNELVTPKCGFLVNCVKSEEQYRAQGFKITNFDLERVITSIFDMPNDDLVSMSKNSRSRYLEMTSRFENNLKSYFNSYFVT